MTTDTSHIARAAAVLEYNLDADLFMRVRRAVGVEETRYYLTGVYVEPAADGGAIMVATDGRAMLVARDPEGVAPAPAIVRLTMPESPPPAPSCCDDGCCALMGDSYVGARLTFDLPDKGPTVAAMMHGARPWKHAIVERVKGTFPKWQKVWSDGAHKVKPRKGHQAYGVNPSLLARITAGEHVVLRPLHDGPAQQVIFDGLGDMAGLIMPCDLTMIEGSAEFADSLAGAKEGSQ